MQSTTTRRLQWAFVFVAVVLSQAGAAQAAAVPTAPEINPGSMAAGLALLAGGALLARARWRK